MNHGYCQVSDTLLPTLQHLCSGILWSVSETPGKVKANIDLHNYDKLERPSQGLGAATISSEDNFGSKLN